MRQEMMPGLAEMEKEPKRDNHINTNKLDYQIVGPFQKSELPDGSVLFLEYKETGKNELELQNGYSWEGDTYTLRMKTKTKTLSRFISIKRTSTNNYFLQACEVGQKTVGGNFRSMTEINEYLRKNFTARIV